MYLWYCPNLLTYICKSAITQYISDTVLTYCKSAITNTYCVPATQSWLVPKQPKLTQHSTQTPMVNVSIILHNLRNSHLKLQQLKQRWIRWVTDRVCDILSVTIITWWLCICRSDIHVQVPGEREGGVHQAPVQTDPPNRESLCTDLRTGLVLTAVVLSLQWQVDLNIIKCTCKSHQSDLVYEIQCMGDCTEETR